MRNEKLEVGSTLVLRRHLEQVYFSIYCMIQFKKAMMGSVYLMMGGKFLSIN